MNIIIAIGVALLAIFVLVALLKLAFNLIILAVAIGLAVAAYLLIERAVGRGR
ncbi:MAG: hypothetical protein K2X73_06670 [Sphingomonas sp.]|uniref:hypothetical protein n=1 Tax=Sphingomonas sp. TaxID=28214 RepID=UPI0025EA34CB|nr:hypothetical protein [Sphingomonas sp.]MBX9881642.1 hypothetical protein [Sphingomonas sp.]